MSPDKVDHIDVTGQTNKPLPRMNITLALATLEEKPIVERLMQLYQYDFTEFDGSDVEENGLFSYPYLPLYWIEPNRRPFLIHVDGNLAGFVLVSVEIDGFIDPPRKVNRIAEFFVLKKYRRHNVGEFAARWIFKQFPGNWEVKQLATNQPAQTFWRIVIGRYTNENFREVFFRNEHHHGPIQTFTN